MWVVPDYCQRLSWPTYPVDWVCSCHLLILKTQQYCLCPNGGYDLPLATHLPQPPTHLPPPTLLCLIHDIIVAMKKSCSKSSSVSFQVYYLVGQRGRIIYSTGANYLVTNKYLVIAYMWLNLGKPIQIVRLVFPELTTNLKYLTHCESLVLG